MASRQVNRASTRRVVLAVGLILLAILTTVRGADPVPVQEIREMYFDYLQRISPRAYSPLPVRVVDIDEASLREYGQWPWPRDRLAALVRKLADYGAAVVVFDVIFAESDRLSPTAIISRLKEVDISVTATDNSDLAALDTDRIFAEAIAQMPVVLGSALTAAEPKAPPRGKAGFVEIGNQPGSLTVPVFSGSDILPDLREAAAGIGMISVSPLGESSLVRTVPLIWNSPSGYHPALSLEALRVALGESTFLLQGADDVAGFLESVSVGGLIVPTLPDGQLWVRYREDNSDLYVPALNVLREGFDVGVAGQIEGNIVLIGTSAAGLIDIRTTALKQAVPGVSIHAQIIEQILLGEFLMRGELIDALEILAFVALGIVVLAVMTRFGPVASITAGVLTGSVVVAGSWYSFSHLGLLFDVTYPLVGGFLAFSGLAAYQFVVADHDKRLIRRSFTHYVAPGILDQIESSGRQIGLGGVNRTVTVMFCDIRNFTPLSESTSANELVSMLNELFTDLGGRILDCEGTIDKFIGDAIMAFWNAPVEQSDHRRKAIEAALRMRDALKAFNARRSQDPISVAIGINSGTACVGNIGSRDRFNYSAIGDAVNVAARIEAACRHVDYDILLTEEAVRSVAKIAVLEAGLLDMKGKSAPTRSYVVVGGAEVAASRAFRELKQAYEALLSGLWGQQEMDQNMLERCCELAEAVEPGLLTYFRAMPRRIDDMRLLAPERQVEPAG